MYRGAVGFGVLPYMIFLNQSICEKLILPHLEDLQIDNTQIYSIHTEGCFSELANLKVLNLSLNFLSIFEIEYILEHNLRRLKNLNEIDVSHQEAIPRYIQVKAILFLSENLTQLDMSSVRRAGDTRPFLLTIFFATNLRYLNFQSNFVTSLLRIVVERSKNSTCTTPFEVDFSRNNMVSFAGSFDDAIVNRGLKVVSLHLSDNKLANELEDERKQVFKYFDELTELDLSSNAIKTLPRSIFNNLRKLVSLNLSRNSLMAVSFQISHMKHLQSLDLSENLASQFDLELQRDLDSLRSLSPNFTIYMLGNPFQCSCETRLLLWWMFNKHTMFNRFEQYSCIYNNTVITFKDMAKLLQTMDYQCSVNFIVKVSASLVAFTVFVIAISFFLYRHKWDVKFFCLRFITNRKAYQELQDDDTEYEYDAFVSYHKDDRGWVRNELHENIDMRVGEVDTIDQADQPRFRLCIHDRDFIPGEAIEENILKAIESSRKTIVVLSKNFLKSAWCEFELQIARKECVEKGRNLIIAVMLEPLSVEDKMSSSVRRLISKNTYIEWPEDPTKKDLFWNKFRTSLDV